MSVWWYSLATFVVVTWTPLSFAVAHWLEGWERDSLGHSYGLITAKHYPCIKRVAIILPHLSISLFILAVVVFIALDVKQRCRNR